jgi:acetylornithine deacetylase/succinyl-diaminopimelate desuccinylase-like protein
MTNGKPTIELGNRGLVNVTLTMKTAHTDLHSGLYGGSAPNAVDEASNFISSLYNKSNKVTIPGFYDEVDDVDQNAAIPFSMENYTKNTGAKVLQTEDSIDFYTQAGQRPSIEITGIHAGYTGEGYKNSIPHKAVVKMNIRLVKSQQPEKIIENVKDFIAQTLPTYVDYTLDIGDFNNPIRIKADNEFIEKAKRTLSMVFHEDPIHRYVGGTEPVVLYFSNILGKPQVLIPFANEDGAMHGSNENFTITNIEKGLEFSQKFFSI